MSSAIQPTNGTHLDDGWPGVLGPPARAALADALLAYVRPRRWFRAKTRAIHGARVADVVRLDDGAALVVVEIAYREGDAERYLVPLVPVDADGARALGKTAPHAIVAHLAGGGALVDGLATGRVAPALVALMRDGRVVGGEAGALRGEAYEGLGAVAGSEPLAARASTAEQSNSSVVLGDRVLLKTYRHLSVGPNPEIELGRLLSAHPTRPPTPRVLGALFHRDRHGGDSSVGVAHEFLSNDGDGWSVALRQLRARLDGVSAATPGTAEHDPFVGRAQTLGRRTAEIHLALFDAAAAGAGDDPALVPEPLTAADRASAADAVRSMWRALEQSLPARIETLPAPARADVQRLFDPRSAERARLESILDQFRDEDLPVVKTRIHGDLHLGQVLSRGDDFVIIDFEGEPARPLAERRAKASPLRDVVGMLRSFDYAPEAVLREGEPAATPGQGDPRARARLAAAAAWKRAVGQAYLRGYRARAADAPFLPPTDRQQQLMLDFHALERVLYEVTYELDNRPTWIDIPLAGLAGLAKGSSR